MNAMQQLLTEHMAIWTAADTAKKSGRGRASGNAGSVYGIKKLRELILELAVRGKLVPQDANDEPASELLKRLQAEKEKLAAEGKIKKDKPLAPIGDDEKTFELPHGWTWARLQEVYDVRDGTHDTPKYQESGFPLVTSKNLYSGTLNFADIKYISKDDHLKIKDRSGVDKGDILFAMIGSIGNPVIVDTDIEFSIKNVALFKPYSAQLSDTSYLLKYLIRAAINLREEAAGAVQSFVSLGVIRNYLIPFPPLAEQHRIVAKVDELMALCDQLEAQHSHATEAHEKLVSHLLGTLTQSQNADDFSANWQRIYAHFDVLFTTEASIDALKKTLLQLAVMGKFVPQDANDEPASELLKRIQAEKAKLVAEGKIKKDKPLVPLADDEKPFKLPLGWAWLKLGDLFTFEYGDNLPADKRSNTGEYPVYGSNGIVGSHNISFVKSPCIVIGRKGSAGALNLCQTHGCCVTDVAYYCIPPNMIDIRFSYKLLHTLGLDELGKGIKPGLNRNEAYELIVAIPPQSEQERIVIRVDELMALCDHLKTRITKANQIQQKLADVMVEQAVAA